MIATAALAVRGGRACAACQAPMDRVTAGEGEVEVCRACARALVPQRVISGLLEQASARIADRVPAETQIAPLLEVTDHPDCPACGARMVAHDYCEAGVVTFSCCHRCALLWLNADELSKMAVMWARMDARLAAVHAQNELLVASAAQFVDYILRAVNW